METKQSTPHVTAYHFVGKTLRDGRPVPPDGEWLVHDGPLRMCQSGLHASIHPFDALTYAPGVTICKVALAGEIIYGEDKAVASQRMIIARFDATDLLRKFARDCALDVIHLWAAPDVVRKYLETGDEALRAAARAAAWAAAWAADRDAAWAAAGDAARAAAWAAAGAAAWDAAEAAEAARAAWAAAGAAARAAWAAAGAKQRQHFNSLIEEAFQKYCGK